MIVTVPFQGFGLSLPSISSKIEQGLKTVAATLPANTWVGKYGRGEGNPIDAAIAEAKKLGREIDPTNLSPAQRAQLDEEMRRQRASSQTNLKTPLLIGAGIALAAIVTLYLLRRRRGSRRRAS